LAGVVILPFAEFRPNRIADGTLLPLITSAGPVLGGLLLALLAIGLAAAFVPGRRRGSAVLSAAVAAFGVLVFAIGGAAASLMPAGDNPARVSVGAGAWIALAGIGIAWFQGARSSGSRWATLSAAVAAIGLLVAAGIVGGLGQLSLVIEYRNQDTFWLLVGRHIMLSLSGVGLGAVFGVPLGILSARVRAVRSVAIPAVSIIQTVPSLALFGLLMVPLAALNLPSIGTLPALIALTLYALLPIVRSTYLGVAGVDPAIVDAGQGMGMSRWQLLRRVEMPLALPLVLEGLRSGLVLTVGIAAVMAIADARDLGTLVFLGFGSQANDLVLLGALPMVVLAVLGDQGMRAVERAVVSPGIRRAGS
jgi:osmoprotectant transport system permease protein